MRIGVFGGTFDPVHLAHLVLAEQCREQFQLEEVWFVPAGQPPHKSRMDITPGSQRVAMLEFALAGHERFRIQPIELNRTGPSYTVETLDQLHRERPDLEFFLLLGADSVRDLPTWREPHRILELARVIGVNRGEDGGDLTEHWGADFTPEERERVGFARMPGLDLSSRDIRERIRTGRSIRYLVPRGVEIFIREQGLYRDSSGSLVLEEGKGESARCGT